MANDLDSERLVEKRPCEGTKGNPGRGLSRAGSLEDRTCLVEPVLLHPAQVGVAGPGPGEGSVPRHSFELSRIDRVGSHDLVPLRPFAVGGLDCHRSAEGAAVPHSAKKLDLVLLEL